MKTILLTLALCATALVAHAETKKSCADCCKDKCAQCCEAGCKSCCK